MLDTIPVINHVECPKCKAYYIRYTDKAKYYKRFGFGLMMLLLGYYFINAMIDENDMDPVIAFGFALGAVLTIGGTGNIIYALVKQLSKKKAIYKCNLCKTEF